MDTLLRGAAQKAAAGLATDTGSGRSAPAYARALSALSWPDLRDTSPDTLARLIPVPPCPCPDAVALRRSALRTCIDGAVLEGEFSRPEQDRLRDLGAVLRLEPSAVDRDIAVAAAYRRHMDKPANPRSRLTLAVWIAVIVGFAILAGAWVAILAEPGQELTRSQITPGPTLRPTATPRPATPDDSATVAPGAATAVPLSADLALSVSSPVFPGGFAFAIVSGVPADETCSVTVALANGARPTGEVAPKTSDARGHLEWMWQIPANEPVGTKVVTVTCGTVVTRSDMVVQ